MIEQEIHQAIEDFVSFIIFGPLTMIAAVLCATAFVTALEWAYKLTKRLKNH